jgi:phage replication-related protein YjqB (UPF0714/DUF867 family)
VANTDGKYWKAWFLSIHGEGIECDFRELGYIISSSFSLYSTENSGLCWEEFYSWEMRAKKEREKPNKR